MSYIPEPITRIDKYLAYIAGNMDVAIPDYPITRKEHYLAAWAEKSGFEDVDVTGEPPLTLENAIGKPLKGLKIYGKSKQVTTTGAQLLEKNEVVHPPNGKVSTIVLFEGELSGTYTVSCALEGNAQYPTRAAFEIIVDGISKFCTINNHTVVTGTITKIVCFAQNTYCDFTGTLHIMLNAGSAPLPWEPYTGGKPSPSPDYPQEIESVGMKWSTGANLVDVHNAIKINAYGLAVAVKDDGTIIISGTSSGNAKNLSFSFLDNKFSFPLTSIFKLFDVEEKNCKLSSVRRTNASDATNNKIVIDINQINSGNPIYCSFKLVVSEKAVEEYEPYTGGVPKPYGDKIGVEVRGKNLLDHAQSMSVATPNGLPGIPVSSGGNYTDADRQQWVCDEIDFARGVYVQRVVKIQASQRKWSEIKETTWVTIYDDSIIMRTLAYLGNTESLHLGLIKGNMFKKSGIYNSNVEGCDLADSQIRVRVKAASFDEAIEKIQDAYFLCALTTPIKSPLTDDQLAAYKQLHTYKGTTIIDNDARAYMSVKYEKMK